MMEPEDELSKLWGIVAELSEQLASNRDLVTQLKTRSDNVKGQAVHVGAGFPLRRFNLDISDEEFHTELEKFASNLVLENQQLQFENKQLNALLKEYEQTLETVMGKFRGVAHASQQHELSLHSYYTSLLQQLQTAHSSSHLHDNTSLSLLLTRLSTLLRSALRSMGGEESDSELSAILPTLISNSNGGGSSGSGGQRSDPSSSPPASPGGSSRGAAPRSALSRAPPAPAMPFAGSSHGASGGYSGTEGRGDWALEREMEIQRLEAENKALRELLAIAEEAPEIAQQIEEDEKSPVPPPPPPQSSGRRKSSLTVAELEASAEKEAEERKAAEDSGEIYQTPEERRDEEKNHQHQQDMMIRSEGHLLQLGPSQETGMGPDGGMSLGFKYGEEPILEGGVQAPPEEAVDNSA